MATQIIDVVHREPFEGGGHGYSGAWFERGLLDDGRSVVLKHLPPEGDWLTRATDGLGRAQWLWSSGLLARVADTVDHAVMDVVRENDHDVVVMEDVSAFLLPATSRLSRQAIHGLLAGLVALHSQWEGIDRDGLCTPAAHQQFASPVFLWADEGPNPCPFRDVILKAWEAFFERVPEDVAAVVTAVHHNPDRFGRVLEEGAPPTLLHGDTRLSNLGLRHGRMLAIDWGELTGTGPAEMDLARFAGDATIAPPGGATWAVDAMPDDLFGVYEQLATRPLDPRTLGLACIGEFAQIGSLLAAHIALPELGSDESVRARSSVLLDWWVRRVRDAAEEGVVPL
jgi:hypothetical protein